MRDANPWTTIPAADYEGHMGSGGTDQTRVLADCFAAAYRAVRPRALAVLGCGPGTGLEAVDLAITHRLVAIDVNAEYVALARTRHARLAPVTEWICDPVETCTFAPASFDLVHAGLFFEYVDLDVVGALVTRWLAPGAALSVVLQLPGGDAVISPTAYPSLNRLASIMRLVPPEALVAALSPHGLGLEEAREIPLPRGKRFLAACFRRT